ncbi:DUF4435 domain-containing protein [Streptococcus salivarius]|uniref:DUF4435 domain-containing protein n=1 Tax=Streptococcus salivarius TaxID=1304 RepID=UPI00191931DC|nr:DUF4435 domain-containing protein [Streptococcus salivarius]
MTKNSRAEEMREKSKNAASAWLDFSQRKNKNMDTYHFFFEGYDRFYYFNKFKEVHYSLLKSYPLCNQYECGGKSEVLKIHQKICREESLLPKNQLLFFIDKDYDNVGSLQSCYEGVYQTDFYSIENYYTSSEVIERIIEEEIGYNRGSTEFDELVSKYEKLHQSFIDKLTDYNLFCMLCLKYRFVLDLQEFNIFSCIDIEDFSIVFLNAGIDGEQLDDIDIKYLVSRYEIQLARKIAKLKGKGEDTSSFIDLLSRFKSKRKGIIRLIQYYKKVKPFDISYFFRGKEDFKFLIRFLKYIEYFYGCKTHLPLKSTEKTLLSHLAKHAIVSPSLLSYFEEKISN